MKKTVTGMYLLFLTLGEKWTVDVGSLGRLTFPPGFYSYTGSGMGGLVPRLMRHITLEKKRHWHIDFFLGRSRLSSMLVFPSHFGRECEINSIISRLLRPTIPVRKFGASDCGCITHLYHYRTDPLPALRILFYGMGMD